MQNPADMYQFEERSYVDNISSEDSEHIEINMCDSDDSDVTEGLPNTVYSVDLTPFTNERSHRSSL